MTNAQTLGTEVSSADLQDFLSDIGSAVALGLVPYLAQAIDIYDTLWAAYDLYQASDATQEQKEEAYFGMAMAAVGWIPGPGDGIKKTLKTVNKNPEKYAPLLLDAVRHTLYQAGYKVNPHAFLLECIDHQRISDIINGAKADIANSSVFQRCNPQVQYIAMMGMDLAASSLPMVVGVVQRKVEKWLLHASKSTAQHSNAAHAHNQPTQARGAPSHQQGNQHTTVGRQGANNAVDAFNGTHNAAEVVMVNINQKQEGIGEHVADFYCLQEFVKGFAALHDTGNSLPAKLTDRGQLSQLQIHYKRRGVGIDAIWKPGAGKPYAVAEYKARDMGLSAQAMKSLLVREAAQDADQKPAHRQKVAQYKKAERHKTNTGEPHNLTKPELAPSVPKMSHKWIQDRVKTRTDLLGHQNALRNIDNYSRHVIQVVTSVGDGKAHKDELNNATEQNRAVNAAAHTSHHHGINNYTNVFTEAPSDTKGNAPKETPSAAKRTKTKRR